MYKIGEFADMFNVSIKTIRFYEKKKLLKPEYVDVYTGYRYYSDDNIKEMARILAFKDLGFGLKEIKTLNSDSIEEKIKQYEENVSKLKKNIDTLKTLLNNNERGDVKMNSFVNDEQAIGKWLLLGIAESKEAVKEENFLDEDLHIKELYLMDNGQKYWVLSWSKGYIYIKNKPYKYEIEDDTLYLYLKGLLDDEKIAVYKRIDSVHHKIEDFIVKDDTNVKFIKDKKLVGSWKTLCDVENPDEFEIGMKSNDNFLLDVNINEDGTGYSNLIKNVRMDYKYTKGYIINFLYKDTMSKYEIRNINGKDYLFIEWKSGDYIYAGYVACYYVLERM